jgi:cytoskeletal protein RodZ
MKIPARFFLLLLAMLLCVSLTGCGDVPSVPSGFKAVAEDGKITVSWNSSASTTYRLYYSTTSGGAKSGTKIDPATSPQVITGLTNGTTYYFAIIAKNSEGESQLSSEISATPGAVVLPAVPTGVSAVPGTGQATVSWTTVSDATSYYVYYSNIQADATKAKGIRLPSTAASLIVPGLTSGTTYYFTVTSANAKGDQSAESTVASATVF